MSNVFGVKQYHENSEAKRQPVECIEKSKKPVITGADFDESKDGERLRTQMGRVFALMRDGQWRTLATISNVTGAPESSASAQLRNLRKLGFTVERRRASRNADSGLFEYRLIPQEHNQDAVTD